MTPGHPSRLLGTVALAISLVLALGACGTPDPSGSAVPVANGSPSAAAIVATPSPTPSASPAASPSSSVDAAAAFLAIMNGRNFTANATIAGAVTVGTASYPVSGTYDVRGPDNHMSVTIAIPGASNSTESLTTGGISYISRDGLWYLKPPKAAGASSDADLASALRSAMDVTDIGTETRAGRVLHHLKPRTATSIPLSAIGMTDPTGKGTIAFEFYVRDDGTPVVMTITANWTQPTKASSEAMTMTMEYTFSNVGGQVVIGEPTRTWQTFKSKRYGYSIAHPADWDVEPSAKKTESDAFFSAEDTGVFAARYPTRGYSLNVIASAYVKETKRTWKKVSVTSNKAAKVDGSKARRIEWTGTYKGTREWHADLVVVRGKYVYIFEYTSYAKLTPSDRSLIDAFLSTMTLPSKGTASTSATTQAG